MSHAVLDEFSTTVETEPEEEPVTLDEAKRQIRQNIPDDDLELNLMIKAARKFCETKIARQFVTATRKLWLDKFPDEIRLPRSPLQSVTTVEYIDVNGTLTTLATADYTVSQAASPGRVMPAHGKSWPSTRAIIEAVRVTYVAGYGLAVAVPETIKLAILKVVAGAYRDRESTDFEQVYETDPSVKALLATEWDGWQWA